MKQAKIKCPHCGSGFTVRQVEGDEIEPERIAAIWAASDEMFKAMDKLFANFFKPIFRRRP